MTAAESPDIRHLEGESLPTGDFPVGGKQDFRVYFAPVAHAQIWKHACENLALEICGVLVGTWQRDAVGPFVTVSVFIRCDAARSGFAEVTFTHEAWTKINAEMDTRLSAFKIVGWYHSHPDFGIFLSDRDIFIHQHFFSGAGQIAHVIDPVRKVEGVFAWQAGKPVLRPHFWVGERVLVTPEQSNTPEPPGIVQAEPIPARAAAADGRPAWLQTITMAAMFVCVFLLGYLLAGRPMEWVRQRERQRELEGLVVYFAKLGVLRPGLEDDLGKLASDLHVITSDVDRLADRHVKLATDEKEKDAVKEQWEEVRARLTGTENNLGKVRLAYSLTPDEQAVVKDVVRELVEFVERGLQAERRKSGGEEGSRPSVDRANDPGERNRRDKPDDSRKKSAPSTAKPASDSSETGKTSTSSRE